MIFQILASNSTNFIILCLWRGIIIFHDFHDSGIEFYEFHDFRDSGMECLKLHYFRYYEVEFYEVHDFHDSGVE